MSTFRFFTAILLLLSLMAFPACRTDQLVPLEPYQDNHYGFATAEARFCTLPADIYRQRLKYIFVVDKSSSNQNFPDATDPQGIRRYAPLSSFLQDSPDDPGYTYYSMIRFATSATVVQDFTDNRLQFKSVVDAEWNRNGFHQPADVGYTNYLSALDAVQTLISKDALASQTLTGPALTSVYVVVFITDGSPIVPFAGNADGVVLQSTPSILSKIGAIRGLKTQPRYKVSIDDILIHTGYYFEVPDSDAQALLADMAAQGDGSAYTFGAGAVIDFTLFAVPVRKVRHLFTDLLVESPNTVWWDDGRLLRDSDEDGLPDEIERSAGSDPAVADSDGNGVSDLVELRIKGRPCKDAQCSSSLAARDNYAVCTGLIATLPGGATIADFDHDGLNDCEELILGSLPEQFDTNADGIPDFLSLKNRVPYIAGVNYASTDADSDHLGNYAEIKIGAPPFAPNARVLNFKPMTYTLTGQEHQGLSDCFEARVENIPIIGLNSRIRLNLIENTAVVDNKKTLRVAEGRLDGAGETIKFSNEDFR